MTSNRKPFSVVAACAAAFALVLLAMPVQAADPVFPTGSRVGLVPPPGMVPSDSFSGFTALSKDAVILIAALPADAYPQIEKSMDVEALKKQGVNVEKREPMQLSFGKGFLLTGRQVADKAHYKKWLLVALAKDLTVLVSVQALEDDATYQDKVVRDALATLAVRDRVPEAEELRLLPFAVGDLAGFHVNGVLRGRALLLSDAADKDSSQDASTGIGAPRLFIAAIPGGPSELEDRGNFARTAFNEIGGIRDVQIAVSEPLRIGGQSGYQTMADAKDARGTEVKVVQWLRFGSGGYLQMVGIARADDAWTGVLSRLRTVRDSVETK